jgi:hypothetical protein
VRYPGFALLLACVIATLLFVVGQGDFVASDPLWYADVANDLSRNPREVFATHENHPFVMRIGLTIPLALLYRLFGVSTHVTNLPCLLSVLTILLVVFMAAPTPRAKLFALLFGVFSTPLIQHATVLNVDLPTAALMATSVLCLSRRTRTRGSAWLIGGAVAWFAAFLVKETAMWCALPWLYAIIADVRAADARRVLRGYLPAAIVGVMLGAGYLWLCAQVWGDPLARFRGIQALTYDHSWSLHGMPARAWLDRLTWKTPLALATAHRALLVPVALAPWLVRGPERIWLFATAGYVLMFWFGSSSLSAYAPLPISGRMMLPILPGIVVIAAIACDGVLLRFTSVRWRIALTLAISAAVMYPAGRAMVAAAVRPAPESAAFATLRAEAADSRRRVIVVCGEPRCVPIARFYFGLAVPANVTILSAIDFAKTTPPPDALVRALINLPRGKGELDRSVDFTARIEALNLPRLAGNANVHLVDAGSGAALWSALGGATRRSAEKQMDSSP